MLPNNIIHFKSLSGSHQNDNSRIEGLQPKGSSGLMIMFGVSHTLTGGTFTPLRFAHGGKGPNNQYNPTREASGAKISGLGIWGHATTASRGYPAQQGWLADGSNAAYKWAGNGTTGFLAFEFKASNLVTGPEYYGWAKVENTDGGPWNDLELLGYAYSDNPNFQTGQTVATARTGDIESLLAMGSVSNLLALLEDPQSKLAAMPTSSFRFSFLMPVESLRLEVARSVPRQPGQPWESAHEEIA